MTFVHLLAWWGVRTLSSEMPLLHLWEAGSAGWWLIRLGRAGLAISIVVLWARLRGVTLETIGLRGRRFWSNALVGGLVVAALWWVVALGRGKGMLGPHSTPYGVRAIATVTMGVDVVAQQLPTFGLLQGTLGSSWWVLIGAWLSFTLAHLVGASPRVVMTAAVIGLVFGVLRRRSANLGAGLGAHFAYYALLILLGWTTGGR